VLLSTPKHSFREVLIMNKNKMSQTLFGSTKINLSLLGVGGWLGLLDDPQAPQAQKEQAAILAVHRAVELGVTYFDTSPAYGSGEAERHLGLGLKQLDPAQRADLCLSTKVGTHPQRPQQYHTDAVRWSLDQSMALLTTDYIDIVYIHDPATDALWIK
jgi:L-galactose dehydrogenase